MRKIQIFLASSNELKAEREKFEIEIYRKSKAWFDRSLFSSRADRIRSVNECGLI